MTVIAVYTLDCASCGKSERHEVPACPDCGNMMLPAPDLTVDLANTVDERDEALAELSRLRAAIESLPVLGCGDASCVFQGRGSEMGPNNACVCLSDKAVPWLSRLRLLGSLVRSVRAVVEVKT